jgi:hypothetical protein
MKLTINENKEYKLVRSENYNYNFNKKNGNFERWGKTIQDDPDFAPFPEILDFEVTTICVGLPISHNKNSNRKQPCPFCYKSNTTNGHNTSFEDFKTVLDKMPKTLTQVAFGADAEATSNPDLFKMMRYTRSIGFIPNITVANISTKTAEILADVCGAVAVSRYNDPELCYSSIKKLSTAGLSQVNMHILIAKETEQWVWQTFRDYLKGNIPGLNAIVLLGLKKKGRGEGFSTLDQSAYSKIINYALDNNIPIGADSCSGPKLIKAVQDRDNYDRIYEMVDPCESTCFSGYVDERCNFYPCSFMPKTDGWETGINMLEVQDFESEVWNNPNTVAFRNKLINNKDCNGCRNCPVFEI